MEKIYTDYKRQIWKIEAKLFNMRKPWLSSLNVETFAVHGVLCCGQVAFVYISDS